MSKRFLLITLLVAAKISGAQSIETTGSNLSPQEAMAALEHHNKVRNDVRVNPLIWSPELAAYAQAWADELARTGCKMRHRPDSGPWKQKHGENIFMGSPSSYYSPLNASESWYSEIKVYKHQPLNDRNWYAAGHYTQMVWNTTTAVGMGKAVCPKDAIIIVANYDPPGNVIGEKAY